jgi:hypothetical protein
MLAAEPRKSRKGKAYVERYIDPDGHIMEKAEDIINLKRRQD